MTKNTVNTGLTANRRSKRVKRVVENDAFAAFTRRILAAHARRVAAGDVEGLAALAGFGTELESLTRAAVGGLREFGYSWAEIAARLGVTRQAVQQRYGTAADRVHLDERIVRAGLQTSLDLLVEVFAQHHPGLPQAATCPACGYRYDAGEFDCPTNAVVRPILCRRRRENPQVFNRLTRIQQTDLSVRPTARLVSPAPQVSGQGGLFDTSGGDSR